MPAPLENLIAQHSALIGLAILLIVFVAFALERRPPVVIAVLGGLTMMVLGFLPVEQALGVFANPAPITIAAMFILSGALLGTIPLALSSFVLGLVIAILVALMRLSRVKPVAAIGRA